MKDGTFSFSNTVYVKLVCSLRRKNAFLALALPKDAIWYNDWSMTMPVEGLCNGYCRASGSFLSYERS